MDGKNKIISERQDGLNRHYSDKIIKILSEPVGMDGSPEKKQSSISCAEAKNILKHTICLIDNRIPLRWPKDE